MGADYYPRLTGVIQDREAATRLVNEQSEIALLLSAPVFIAMIGLTPWVIRLLYSPAFLPAVEVLRWQILGDVLKVAGWPLGFVTLAAGAGRTFFWLESGLILLLGGLIAAFCARFGLQVTGMAFLACYALYLPVVYRLAARRIGFSWRPQVIRLLLVILALCVLVALLSARYWWGGLVSVGLALGFAAYALTRLALMSDLGGGAGRLAALGQRLAGVVRRSDNGKNHR
jgi:PST family polysaccharide transporter